MSDVYLNGKLIGTTSKPQKYVKEVIEARRQSKMIPELNLSYDDNSNSVYINTDKGRARRPLIIVE